MLISSCFSRETFSLILCNLSPKSLKHVQESSPFVMITHLQIIKASALRGFPPGTSLLTSLNALLRKETQHRPADSSFDGHAPVIIWVRIQWHEDVYLHTRERLYIDVYRKLSIDKITQIYFSIVILHNNYLMIHSEHASRLDNI